MMYGWYGNWSVWGWIVMGIMMLLFWGGIAVLIVFLVRGARHEPRGYEAFGPRHEDPEYILAQRFARGEIDETEFKARRDALRRGP